MNIKREIIFWLILVTIGALIWFVGKPIEEKQQLEKQRQQAQETERQAEAEAARKEAESEYLANIERATQGSKCNVTYSDWSLCTPQGQFRIVEELDQDCSIGPTTRACQYTYNPVFDMSPDRMMQVVVEDLRTRNGSFRYTSYYQDQNTTWRTETMLMLDNDNGLTIQWKSIDTSAEFVIADLTMSDVGGDYRPDGFSEWGGAGQLYVDVNPEIASLHLEVWEDVIKNYVLVYAEL